MSEVIHNRIFDALPAYLGGKRRLAPLILASVARVLPRERWATGAPRLGGGSNRRSSNYCPRRLVGLSPSPSSSRGPLAAS